MAIEIMLQGGKAVQHQLRHDLESLLYVIIWDCTHMKRANELRKDTENLNVRSWCTLTEGLDKLALLKMAHLDCAQSTLLSEIPEYWDDFKPFLLELISHAFPTRISRPNQIEPGKMKEILTRAMQTVKEPEPTTPPKPPVRGKRTSKQQPSANKRARKDKNPIAGPAFADTSRTRKGRRRPPTGDSTRSAAGLSSDILSYDSAVGVSLGDGEEVVVDA